MRYICLYDYINICLSQIRGLFMSLPIYVSLNVCFFQYKSLSIKKYNYMSISMNQLIMLCNLFAEVIYLSRHL